MPGMVLFGRRWAIASDDLVFPGAFELFLRVVWWIGILILYLKQKGKLNCVGGALLNSYLIVLIILLAVIICVISAVVYVSMKGTICNPGPRKSMPKLIYIRLALFLPEMVWASLGVAWIADSGVHCDKTVVNAIIATVIVRCSYITDTDLVPSDIAAGLTLLHQQQDKKIKDPEEVVCHFLEASQESDLDTELENCHHYVQFAAAAYGWPLYIYRNPLTGFCKIGCDCCRNRTAEFEFIGGDNLTCHFGSILHTTGLQYRDFIHISFHDKVFELPFLVALDHRKETIVVAVRGTMSLQDILTDLSAESESLNLECEVQDCFAHKGISQAAKYVYQRLINDGILSQAFSIAPEYQLVLVGHSLGAGAASLLAIMLKNSYPEVKCYAFSPPRGLLSKSLSEYSKSFIISLVLGKDVIPRLSVTNLEDLKRRILRVIAHCNKPKYKILLRGCWYELFGGDPDNFPTELEGGNQEDLTQPLLGEQSLLIHGSPSYNFFDDSPRESPTRYPHLYPPGRIIHLVEDDCSGRSCCCSTSRYSARWATEAEFSKILIGPKMLTDHMPDILIRALDHVVSERSTCISCPTQGDFNTNVA
ncbi:diacylglycerol lipase-beta [Gracilinanus agilis]|uniref:diacylglycerol lipase-beta n=1 Tax=Gracilinanus agilis TaxID=191870 RepID=UPI001CFE57A6|nr:diacylglycerol lipase-beta [Gracilinanus agilis]